MVPRPFTRGARRAAATPKGSSVANHFVKASFTLRVTHREAGVLRQIEDALAIFEDGDLEPGKRAARFAAMGDEFAACFPPSERDPLGGFLGLFSDPDFPRFGCTMQVDPPGEGDSTAVWIHGDQVDIEATAALI